MDDLNRWYVAVLVVRITVDDDPEHEPATDRQIRLIRAPDPETAYTRALVLGAQENRSYLNGDGRTVRWEFVGLADLDELQAPAPADEVEVYSERLSGDAEELVRPKSALTIFWLEANRHRRVRDVLDESGSRAV